MHFITFSRMLGSGGTEIAKRVAEALGYAFVDTETIDNKAREMGLLESVEQADEKAPTFFQRFFSHKPAINLDRLNSVIYELAEQGDSVFIGRGGQILLKSFTCALHVRVIASLEKRIQNLMERNYPKDVAIKAIDRSDHERSGFVKFAFGKNWEDPHQYDTILNMDKLDVDTAVEAVLAIARSGAIKSCSLDSLDTLKKLALENRVEAALVESGLTTGQITTVNVSVDEPGVVRLTGIVEDTESKKRAEEIVKAVAGVTAVEDQIHVIPADRHA